MTYPGTICFSMDVKEFLKSLVLFAFPLIVKGETLCPKETCWDDDSYCCDGYCCREYTSVFELWWFWFIWVVIFLLVVSCGICIRRRRAAARARYIRVAQVPPTSSYNTIVTNQYTHVQAPRYHEQPTAPVYPGYQQTQIPKQPPPPYQ